MNGYSGSGVRSLNHLDKIKSFVGNRILNGNKNLYFDLVEGHGVLGRFLASSSASSSSHG